MPGKAWEACAGRSAILPTTTTASIVSVILFPCVVVLIITPTDPGWGKKQKKGPHWKKEWGKWMIEFFLYPPVPLFLSTNSVLVGSDVSFRARRVFFLCVCEILCCFESVRTVCLVQECGSMLRHRQVRCERVWKESLSEISGNETGTRLLKSTLTLGTN